MAAPRQVAEAFSGHRFRDVYDALAPDVVWTGVGEWTVTGRQAVQDTCETTLAALSTTTTEFLRFVVIGDGDAVAVDAVGRYVDAAGTTSLVSSADIYEFRDGLVRAITSYTVELEPGTPSAVVV